MIKKTIIIICTFLVLSCISEKPQDLQSKIEINLNQALKKFEPTNNAFLFSIFHNDTCIIQIMHRSYVDILRHSDNSFGFALNLPFDSVLESEKINYEKFQNMEISKSFKTYDLDGVPCYAIDFNKNVKKASELTADILKSVYGFDNKTKLEFELLDHGGI